MTLLSGAHIGPYQITAEIGAGGMGEVYRARDAKLGRDVAIKVLPEAFARDAERMARFQREAKLLASLNHPNIAAIYGFEDSRLSGGQAGSTHALVMELVEGPTLAERINGAATMPLSPADTSRADLKVAATKPNQGRPIPIEEALRIAKQICEGLEYAHERGIVHRDLKPANIKVTTDDAVKILDFGLAKAVESDSEEADISTSPTLTRMATQAGFIIGTAAYMSPEQAKAKPVDRRADIWAFGCVLYEMLTGKMAFTGETVTDTLAAVIMKDPDWSLLPKDTPLRVRVLLQRCLQKEPKQRLQAIGDARISLDEVLSGAPEPSSPAVAAPPTPAPFRRRALFAIVGTAGLIVVGVAAYFLGRSDTPRARQAMHFSAVTDFPGVQAQPSFSPDGRSVTFISNHDGHYNVYVALISAGSLVQITNDPNLKSRPEWSPDGTTIAYSRLNDSGIWDIWEVAALGGTPRRVILNASDPAWSPDSHSLVYENMANGALYVSGGSGENAHQAAGNFDGAKLDTEPRFSPDGRKLAFAARDADGGPYGELALADLDSGKTRFLTRDKALALSPAWSPDGKFIYFASSRGGTLNIWKIGADGSGGQQITAGEGDDAELDVSADGKRIVFATLREKIGIAESDLQAVSGRSSVQVLTTDPARNQWGPTYSPDGKHLAFFTNLKGIGNENVWVAAADGTGAAPVVQDARVNVFPSWGPDGNYLTYLSEEKGGRWEYRRIPVSGGAPQTLLTTGSFNLLGYANDGRALVDENNGKVETLDPRSGKTEELGALPANSLRRGQTCGSPDGSSIAYAVDPSEENDPNAGLWVDDFKNPPRQVFHGWVVRLGWHSRSEIYFLEGKPDLNGVLWKVGWDGKGLARTSATVPILYNLNYRHTALENQFDASPDGQHVAFQTEQVLEENIGMIENVR